MVLFFFFSCLQLVSANDEFTASSFVDPVTVLQESLDQINKFTEKAIKAYQQVKIAYFTFYQTTQFQAGQNIKHLQMTI